MAGIAHAGVGLAAKRFAPKAPLGLLMVGTYLIDVIWGFFFVAGIERLPKPGHQATNALSHGLFMSLNWSALAAAIAAWASRSARNGVLFGLLVFSHWVVDSVTKPMKGVFPDDTGLPLFFDDSRTVGLGLYRTKAAAYAGDLGALVVGIVIYALALKKLKNQKPALDRDSVSQ
jgi:hypothetical protein